MNHPERGAYIRVWKKREARWLTLDEYRILYSSRIVRPRFEQMQACFQQLPQQQAAAMQSIKGGMYIPGYPGSSSGAPGTSTVVLDAAGEAIANIGPAPVAGEVAGGIFRTGTVTTGDTCDLRLETVDEVTTGDPTGTLLDTNSNIAVAIAAADDNKTFLSTFTATATITKDQMFALVLVNGAGGGNMQINFWNDEAISFPYIDHFTAAWAKIQSAPLAGLFYSGPVYHPIEGFWPIGTTSAGGASVTTITFGSGSAADEIGNILQFPYPGTVTGYWIWADLDAAADVLLYDNAGNAIAGMESNLSTVARGSTAASIYKRYFESTYDFAASTNFRMVVKPTTASTLTIYEIDVPSAAAMDHFDGGQLIHKTSRVDAGSFSQVTTKRLLMGVLVNAYSDGAGSGGIGALRAGGLGVT